MGVLQFLVGRSDGSVASITQEASQPIYHSPTAQVHRPEAPHVLKYRNLPSLSHTQIHHHGHTQLLEPVIFTDGFEHQPDACTQYVCLYTYAMRDIESIKTCTQPDSSVQTGQLRCAASVVTQGVTVRGAPHLV